MRLKAIAVGAVVLALSLGAAAQGSVFTENANHATASRFVTGTALAPYGWWAPSGVGTPIWEQYRKFTASSDSTQPQVTVANSRTDLAGATIYGATVSTGSNGGGLFFGPDGAATPSGAVLYLDQLRHGGEVDDMELRIGYMEAADVGSFLDAATKNGDGYVGHTSEADLHPADTPANMQYIRLTVAGMGAIRNEQGFAETGLNFPGGRTEDARTILPVTTSGVPGIPPYRITSRLYDDGLGNKRLEVTVGGWVGWFPMSLATANGQAFKNGAFNTASVAPVVYVGKLSGADLSYLAVNVYSDAAAPALLSATVLDQTHVQVFFSKPVDRVTAENASNYALSGGLTVSAAFRSYDERSVTLTTSAVSRGPTTTLTVNNVQDTVTPANTIAANSQVTFTAPPPNPPTILSVTDIDGTHVQVAYSKPVDLATSQALANYAINNGITISAASLGWDNVTLTLTVSTLTPGVSYSLTVNNILDQDSIPSMIVSPTVVTFSGPPPSPPTVLSAAATNMTHLSVVFSQPVTAASATVVGNYAIAGLSVTAASLAGDGVTVTLTTSVMASSAGYTLTVNAIQNTLTPALTIAANSTIGFTSLAPPAVASTTVADAMHVTVVFTMGMDPATVATIANYSVNNGIAVSGVSRVNATTVTLTTSPMSIGVINTMSITNVQDTLGDTIGANTETFVYKVMLVQYPFGTAGFNSTTTGAGLSAAAPVTLNNVNSRSVTGNNGGYSNNMLEWGCQTATASTASFTKTGTSATNGAYIEFGVTVASGYTANLSNITFTAQENWGPDAKGMFLESSLSGYSYPAGVLFSIHPLSWQGGGTYQVAPYYSSCSVNLSGAAFQNIPGGTTVTFRLYGFSSNTENWALQTDDITLWGGTTPVGTPPSVAITSPTSTASATLGTTVAFSATASSVNTITSVQFFDGATLLGSGADTGGGVYTFAWNTTGATGGLHNITAKANDNTGQFASSTPPTVVNISVVLPTVAITSPTSTTTAQVGTMVTFAATASTTNLGGSIAGVQFFDGATLLGSGADTGGGVYTFAWNTTGAASGLHNVTAKATDNLGTQAASSPATVLSLWTAVAPTAAITSPTSTYSAQVSSTVTFTATASTANPGGSVTGVQLYDGGALLGSGAAAGGNTWTYSWSTVGSATGTHGIRAKATDNLGGTASSSPATIINLWTPVAPAVAITLPTGTPTSSIGTTVTFTATASTANPGGSIAGVQLYDGGALLGSGAAASGGTWTYAWNTTGAAAGAHAITAKATDNLGGTATSSPAKVINLFTPVAPAVAITSPTSTVAATIGSTVTFTATASTANPGGSIAGVQLYDGGALLGSGAAASGGTWTYAWNTTGAAAGAHAVTAKATDNLGGTATSAPATVISLSTPVAPAVAITSPTGTVSSSTGTTVTFTATASTANPGGSIAGVQLYDGTTLLGSGAAAGAGTWTYAWNTTGATAGAHNVKAKATDNLGGTATSSPAVVVQLSGGPVVLLKYTFPTALASNATGTAYDPTTIASGLDTTATGTALMRFGWGSGLTGGGTNIGSNGYATDPEVQVHPTAGTGANSTASTTIAVGDANYMVFALQPVSGQKILLTTLEFDIARGGGSTRGYGLESSVDGFGTSLTQIIQSADLTATRPTFQHVTVDLSASKFQNLTAAITFRLYLYVNGGTNSIEFDNVTLSGSVVVSGASDPVVTSTSTGQGVAFADANSDGVVNGEDYGAWQNGYGLSGAAATLATGDFNGDGVVDGEDYGVWQNNYGHTFAAEDGVAATSQEEAAASSPMSGGNAPRLVSVTPSAAAVALVFDSDVVVGSSAVEVSGLVSGPQTCAAAYDAATRTLTLTFGAALSPDVYTVRVIGQFVVGVEGGAALDGAGNGTPGSDAQVQFTAE